MKYNFTKLRKLRKAKGISQEYLQSDLAALGFRVSRVTLHYWEKGKANPSLDGILALAEYYKVPVMSFFTKKLNKTRLEKQELANV